MKYKKTVYKNISTGIELEVNRNVLGILINYASGAPTIKIGSTICGDEIMIGTYISSAKFVDNDWTSDSVFISIAFGEVDIIVLQKENKAKKKSVVAGFIRDYNNFNTMTLKDYFRELQELRAVNFNLNKELKERDSSEYVKKQKLEINTLKRQLDSEKEKSKGYQDLLDALKEQNNLLRCENNSLAKGHEFSNDTKKFIKRWKWII